MTHCILCAPNLQEIFKYRKLFVCMFVTQFVLNKLDFSGSGDAWAPSSLPRSWIKVPTLSYIILGIKYKITYVEKFDNLRKNLKISLQKYLFGQLPLNNRNLSVVCYKILFRKRKLLAYIGRFAFKIHPCLTSVSVCNV